MLKTIEMDFLILVAYLNFHVDRIRCAGYKVNDSETVIIAKGGIWKYLTAER